MICDDLAVAAGGSGNKSLGWTVLGIWIAGLALTTATWVRAYRIQREIELDDDYDAELCTKCQYNLTGNVSGVCPECGTPIAAARAREGCQGVNQ